MRWACFKPTLFQNICSMPVLKKFAELPKNEQIYHITHVGKLLADRNIPGFTISLYAINEQLVEVWYDQSKKRIERIEVVEPQKIIDLYPVKFNIREYLS